MGVTSGFLGALHGLDPRRCREATGGGAAQRLGHSLRSGRTNPNRHQRPEGISSRLSRLEMRGPCRHGLRMDPQDEVLPYLDFEGSTGGSAARSVTSHHMSGHAEASIKVEATRTWHMRGLMYFIIRRH